MYCACGGHLEFSQPCISEKIRNNFFAFTVNLESENDKFKKSI